MLTYKSTGVHTNRDKTAKGKVNAVDRSGNKSETPAQKQARQKQERREAGGQAVASVGQGMMESGAARRDAMMNEPDAPMARPAGKGGVGQALLDKYVYKK